MKLILKKIFHLATEKNAIKYIHTSIYFTKNFIFQMKFSIHYLEESSIAQVLKSIIT